MRLKNTISICLLSVYAMVMAHSFIPHHHHSEFATQTIQHCGYEKQQEHNCCEHGTNQTQTGHSTNKSCIDEHHHSNHSHSFCSFEERVVLTKGINLSNLFLPSSEIKIGKLNESKHPFLNTYTLIEIIDPQCRDVQLRGPPHFS